MTDADDQSQETELKLEARASLRRLVSGEATIADLEEVKRWRERSAAHEAALASAAALWNRLGPACRNLLEQESERAGSARHVTRRAMLGGAAVAAAAYVIARPPYEIWPSFSELVSDYRTVTGEQKRIALADGTLVQMNTQTSIAMRSPERDHDRIELVAGEAAITIGHDQARPLTVMAGGGRISAQQATFNVRYDGHAVCVTCLEGYLRLEHRAAVLGLHAHQQATYGKDGLGQAKDINPDVVTAWQQGLLVFETTPLSEVIADINRYRPGRIVLLNAELGRLPISAQFTIDHLDEIMTLAQRVVGAKLTLLPGGVVLLS